jgi:hypothetical protein
LTVSEAVWRGNRWQHPMGTKKRSQKAAKKEETGAKKQAKPRKARRKACQMRAATVVKKTAILPEPMRLGVVALAQAIVRFFQRGWQALSGAGSAEMSPLLLPPGRTHETETVEARHRARWAVLFVGLEVDSGSTTRHLEPPRVSTMRRPRTYRSHMESGGQPSRETEGPSRVGCVVRRPTGSGRWQCDRDRR